ncbi:DUF1707 domain-containing protein [Planomonospora sp. ID82291]|uniref:DUF1707 SHOCT-like domain-containing protein n=1 Tax=Planomonospora sp. ID82291 TaxID=2738136 RepID=UPI0018C3E409|nr:DUF1707 domain-containing protein [Planomonospora sp. ID82291]MBG0813175.1 DUF1707 and DUF2154 domain-containing protein [Planomonospora sp. ID82291]
MTDHRHVRASDHDRERVAEVLRIAVAEGRITLEELEERVDRAYTARTLGELDDVVVDLPGFDEPIPSIPSSGAAGLELHTGSGRVEQVGRWRVPQVMSARAGRWGKVRIDFTRADCPHREVVLDVEVTSWFGDITVLVPRGWRVRDDEVVRHRLGAVHNRPPEPPAPDGVTVRLTGRVQTGDVWVRYRRAAT